MDLNTAVIISSVYGIGFICYRLWKEVNKSEN
jgi:hypothetical protein